MGKASQALMEKLHGVLAKELSDAITNGVEEMTKDGELVRVKAPSALLSVARQFLKDNHIEAGVGNSDLSDLEKAMNDMNELPMEGEVPPEYRN